MHRVNSIDEAKLLDLTTPCNEKHDTIRTVQVTGIILFFSPLKKKIIKGF